jgi:glycosyltransferase involved in cell wall biosynthesis
MKLKVAVLDMQPISPAVGGGRLRLLGLYHALGSDIEAKYVGTYDWPGEKFRKHQLTNGLEETTVPLSPEHHQAARELSTRANGKNIIDLMFHKQARLSPNFIAACRETISWADVVVFSHPWVYPLVRMDLQIDQTIIYDSHNVEGLLRAQLLDESDPIEQDILREVASVEYALCRRANLILACSHEDLLLFSRLYGISANRIRVVPNGVMSEAIRPASLDEQIAARRTLQIGERKRTAVFVGSDYPPNVAAARFIVDELAPRLPEVLFVILGGVGAKIAQPTSNVVVTGTIDDATKCQWLRASDVALNPMFSGSGTNIKMFDFMAAALPTLTTAIGARGITNENTNVMRIVEPRAECFEKALRELLVNDFERHKIGKAARACVEDNYAWEGISPAVGRLISTASCSKAAGPPLVTVVIPSYERHAMLEGLMQCLADQSFRDFEVVVVDQSSHVWARRQEDFGFPLNYWHTRVRGAVRARNTGAFFARGAIIAFTDDDCRPAPDWLSASVNHFLSESIVGIEGLIESDHLGDPAFRPVTNVGFEGIGFMTANLFVRTEQFLALGGFDLAFDRPHFREDTDFGWRLLERGAVPYHSDVKVFHPAQPRSIERESDSSRARFFEKDALLFRKHPSRYRHLFKMENHWMKTKDFWEHFLRGGKKYGVDLSDFHDFFREHVFKERLDVISLRPPILDKMASRADCG